MSDFLTAMAVASRLRADEIRLDPDAAALPSRAMSAKPARPLELSDQGFDIIAEAKLASPSEGRLAVGEDLAVVLELSSVLAASGPAALSILTEPERFCGSVHHLESVARDVEVPVMRKDFLVDPVQIFEARAAGASGVLLIARILTETLLIEMTNLAVDLGMFVLLEVFDERDLDPASVVFDREVLVGVNARDLGTLRVDPQRHSRMARLLPSDRPLVAESGILAPDDARRVADLGYRLALVGTALVSHDDPGLLAREMTQAGRAARTSEEVS